MAQLQAETKGTTRARVNLNHIRQIKIPLPPLNEQRRIVAKLESIFARTRSAREELEKIGRLCDRYKQAVLSAACTGQLTEIWRKSNKLADLKKVCLREVAKEFSYGSSAKSAASGIMPVLRMGNIQSGSLDWRELVYTSNELEIQKYRLEKGDVLFNRTNSPELVGKTAIYKGEQEAIYAGYLIRIKCDLCLLPEFLNYTLNSPLGRSYCWQVKTDGVSQSNINAKKLGDFVFELPTLTEQEEIVRRVKKQFKSIDRIEQEYQKALKLCDRLEQAALSKAFRGELVPQDPNDEPASVLLDRIAAQKQQTATSSKKSHTKTPKIKQLAIDGI